MRWWWRARARRATPSLNAASFDLVVLDLMLPGRDGLEVLATLQGPRPRLARSWS